MSGDDLASGRKRSAQFAGAGASVDDEVVINPGVVAPEDPELKLTVTDRRRSYLDDLGALPATVVAPVKEFPDTEFETGVPILDRLLVMVISDDPNEELLEDGSTRNKITGIITTAAYRQHTNVGIVLDAGNIVTLGHNIFPMSDFVKPRDKVFYGDYNSELFKMSEENAKKLCRKHKINFVKTERGIRVVRIQDVRMVESAK